MTEKQDAIYGKRNKNTSQTLRQRRRLEKGKHQIKWLLDFSSRWCGTTFTTTTTVGWLRPQQSCHGGLRGPAGLEHPTNSTLEDGIERTAAPAGNDGKTPVVRMQQGANIR